MLIQGWYTEEWGVFTAGALLGAAPVIIVFYALQNQLVSGLTQGAIKG
jgi:arabinogalactan oligomer/maltooligosaccharide transport system permease protein